MQKVRRDPYGLRLLVSMPFQDLFHSPPGDLFHLSLTVLYAIDHTGVFRLRGWYPYLPTHAWYSYAIWRGVFSTGLSPSLAWDSTQFMIYLHNRGLFHFRSPLLAKSRLMSLPLGTEMFQFPR